MKKKLIIGWGASGKAAGALLEKLGISYLAYDDVLRKDIPHLDEEYLEDFDQIILSPGFDPRHPFIWHAKKKNIEIIGELELGLRHVKNPCVGITGTNGKTTTTLLSAHFLSQNQIPAKALGNIGEPLCTYLLNPDEKEVLLIECSSYQLETVKTRAFEIGLILNITPNHLDRYQSFREYAEAKLRLQHFVKDPKKFLVSESIRKEFLLNANSFLEEPSSSLHPQNISAAKAICSLLGASRFSIQDFQAPKHRLEYVGEKNGIIFYNDSKATNIEAVISAVKTLSHPIILICGGVHKGSPYTPWKKAFRNKVKKIIVIGNSAKKIHKELESDFEIGIAETLHDAVLTAYNSAKAKDCILLSPGCSSFDLFKNFEHRGEEFIRMSQKIIRGESS